MLQIPALKLDHCFWNPAVDLRLDRNDSSKNGASGSKVKGKCTVKWEKLEEIMLSGKTRI